MLRPLRPSVLSVFHLPSSVSCIFPAAFVLSAVLINLLPDFLAVLGAGDREAAYRQYRESHRPILDAYWRNYVLDPDSPHAGEIVTAALRADRSDLLALADSVNLVQLAEDAIARAEEVLQVDRPTDTYLMVGLGGANAGELVVGGRGVAFICLEHFTGRVNPETYGMGLPPDLIPLWIGHELAHTVRYTSPTSGSDMRRLVTRGRRLLRLLVHRQPRDAAGAAGQRGARRARRAGGGARVRCGRLLRLSPAPVSPAARDGGLPPARGRARPRAERARAPAALSLGRHEPVARGWWAAGCCPSGRATTWATG